MPKTDIDYSNTIIYKITCKDIAITDVYVGHTTNFVQRKHAHKQSCINVNSVNYNVKLYEVIRTNGGWNNWKMEIINFFECKDHYEARTKEQEYFVSLNATLNSIEPMPKPKVTVPIIKIKKKKEIFGCTICNIQCNSSKLLEEHNATNKHIRKLDKPETLTKKSQTSPSKFSCVFCNYNCSKKSDFDKHNLTSKHIVNTALTEKVAVVDLFECKICSKVYNSRVGLWYHNKKCNAIKNNTIKNNIECDIIDVPKIENNQTVIDFLMKENSEMKNIVLEVVKSNADLQKQMFELCKSTSITNNNNINNHSNNKTFNLQFFLNEQCKDAMNISDFANSFDLQLSDLESVGDLGYVEGITKIMIDRLNSMDIYKRPIHCSDVKRETLYVKDDNKWEKEERNNPKIRYAIKTISFRNMKLAALWSDTYPESKDYDSHVNERYMKLIKESTGGSGEITDNENKIIRKIAKEFVIDKM
jgi:hypothetical protein